MQQQITMWHTFTCSERMWTRAPEHNKRRKDSRWWQCHSRIVALAGQPSPTNSQFKTSYVPYLWRDPHQWPVGYDSRPLHFGVSVLSLWSAQNMSISWASLSKLYPQSWCLCGLPCTFPHMHYTLVIYTFWVNYLKYPFRTTLSRWIIYLGRETQSGLNVNEVNRTVSEIIVHPDWNETLFNNDIALMKLSTPVTFTDYIRPICLAKSSSQIHNATLCYATGWGKLSNTSEYPLQFQYWFKRLQYFFICPKFSICKRLYTLALSPNKYDIYLQSKNIFKYIYIRNLLSFCNTNTYIDTLSQTDVWNPR